ncbi:MAG: FkbM family methyltransferase [Actinobacteria bacterium]|nr:FkbM family methyltransferase [Actinomycetota bacterium]MCA1720943.1 FkbM family methyltransferase [Actinomycetota bacterium]
MGLLTSAPALRARILLRRFPTVHALLARTVNAAQGGYEARFEQALTGAVRPSDCVWDVGANVGLYVPSLLDCLGPSGVLVAVEPAPECVAVLRGLAAPDPRLRVAPVALSDRSGDATFSVADGATAVSNGLREGGDMIVPTVTGDELVGEDVPAPNVVKIDVEGFEWEVLRGMPGVLADSRLHTVLVEVHFSQLADRGMTDAPAHMVRLLEAARFTVGWTDPSHLVARRP